MMSAMTAERAELVHEMNVAWYYVYWLYTHELYREHRRYAGAPVLDSVVYTKTDRERMGVNTGMFQRSRHRMFRHYG